MGILGKEAILKEIEKGTIKIEPFDKMGLLLIYLDLTVPFWTKLIPLFVPEVRNKGLWVLSKFFLNTLKALYVLFEGKLELIPKKFGLIIFLLILLILWELLILFTLWELLTKLFFLG